MRRALSSPLALLAGLAFFLHGCAGESPTGAGNPPSGPPGSCGVAITLKSSFATPFAGTGVFVAATVTRNNAPVADGTSVLFSTDLGFFLENSSNTISKLTVGDVAEVTLASVSSGDAHVKATVDCATTPVTVAFQDLPVDGPFISSITPDRGTCVGGTAVTINGGKFGTDAGRIRVTFGGARAQLTLLTNNQIVVTTPERKLANAQVPEVVDLDVVVGADTPFPTTVRKAKAYTYYCVDKPIFISSVVPNSGDPLGGDAVIINGGNFTGTSATTRVTFGGVPATINSLSEVAISALTPAHALANKSIPETVDVAVSTNIDQVSAQTAVAPRSYTYRASGPDPNCNTNPGLYLSAISPNTGPPTGGTVVSITGGGFGSLISRVRVDLGTRPAQVTSVSPNQITISTPQITLSNPEVAETYDLVVTVDAGGPQQACARIANAFTYTRLALDPVIYSTSPRSGPNDSATRVTIFGTGFQFPMQVFLTGGACGATRVEAKVDTILPNTIVFQTPTATNNNSCLAGQLATIEIVNPVTGKKTSCPDCFRYYACPRVSSVSPTQAPYYQESLVTVIGSNFEEPVEATFVNAAAPTQTIRLTVTSVSSGLITVRMPAIDPLTAGGSQCANVVGQIQLSFIGVDCPAEANVVDFTYKVDPPQVQSATPTTYNQDGSPAGNPLGSAPATVTVNGAFFQDPMTVVLTKADGTSIDYTRVNNPIVSNVATLTFPAPAIRNGDLNEQACLIDGTPSGNKYVPTSFGIRVRNVRTGCETYVPNLLVYNPADATCRSKPFIDSGIPPSATICAPYGPYQLTAKGGVQPYFWSTTNLPAGLILDPSTGAISGTPKLQAAGAGGTTTPSFTVTVTDSTTPVPQTATRTFIIAVNDPNGPFSVSGNEIQAVPAAGGSGTLLTAVPNSTFQPIKWTIDSVTPAPLVPFGQAPSTGPTYQIYVPGANAAGVYTVVVRATDTPPCGGPAHTAAFTVTMTKNP